MRSLFLCATFVLLTAACSGSVSTEPASSGGEQQALPVPVLAPSCERAGACTGNLVWADDGGGAGSHGGQDVAVDAAGNVLVTGRLIGGMEIGGAALSADDYQAYVLALDADGTARWSVVAAGSSEGRSVAVDGAGNVIVGGTFHGSMELGGRTVSSSGAADVFVAKLDTAGQLVWLESFGGGNPDWVSELAVGSRGDVVVFGGFEGSTEIAGTAMSGKGEIDVFVLELSAAGEPLWAAAHGTSGYDYALGVAVGRDGEIALAGSFEGSLDLGGGPLASDDADGFLAVLDADGEHIWSRRVGGAGHDLVEGVAIDPQGRVAVGGLFSHSADLGGEPLLAEGNYDAFVARYDRTGEHLSSGRVGGPAAETYVTRIAADGAGNVVAFGTFTGTMMVGGVSVTAGGGLGSPWSEDLWVVKQEPDGEIAWQKTFGGPARERAFGLAVSGTGEVLLTGDFQGTFDFGGGPLTAPPGDGWGLYLAKLAP